MNWNGDIRSIRYWDAWVCGEMGLSLDQVFSSGMSDPLHNCINIYCETVGSWLAVLLLLQPPWARVAGDLLIPTPKGHVVPRGCVNSFSASLVLSSEVLRSQLFCCLHFVKLNLGLPGPLGHPSQCSFQFEFLSRGWLALCSSIESFSISLSCPTGAWNLAVAMSRGQG